MNIQLIALELLLLVVVFHLYWAIGGRYGLDKVMPTDRDGNELWDSSQIMAFGVAIVMGIFAYVSYELSQGTENIYFHYAGWIIALIFFSRVIGDFELIGISKKLRKTTFSRFDDFLYVPLCLFLAISFSQLL